MRTTLDIDADLLTAAKELARRERSTAGEVVSRLLRQALTTPVDTGVGRSRRKAPAVAGFEPFPALRGVVTTNEDVERLREIEGI